MDNQQAKFVLSAYRPDGQDARDETFADALSQVEADPELKDWLADQRAFDSVFGKKLRETPVPSDLKETILVGQKVTPFPSMWRRPATWMSAVAAILLALLVGVFAINSLPQEQSIDWARFQSAAIARVNTPSLSFVSSNLEDVRAWLAQNNSIHDFVLPEALRDRPAKGCCVLTIQGKPAALICFQMQDGSISHLLLIKIENVDDPPGTSPAFSLDSGWQLATWTRDQTAYLLAVNDSLDISKLL